MRIDADKLLTQRAIVGATGSVDIAVHATELLDVSLSGSGKVRYSGNPHQVRKAITGAGTLEAHP